MSFLLPNALRLASEAPSPSARKDASRAEASKSDNRTTFSSRGPEILWLAVFEVGHDGGLPETATDENDDVDGQDRRNFDETRRSEGADSALDLLFYWTEETTTTKERVLQQLGLLRGAAAFCSSMTETPKSQSSDRLQCASLRSQKRRSVLIQTESATYLAAVSLPCLQHGDIELKASCLCSVSPCPGTTKNTIAGLVDGYTTTTGAKMAICNGGFDRRGKSGRSVLGAEG